MTAKLFSNIMNTWLGGIQFGKSRTKIISILFIIAFIWIIMLLNAGPPKPKVLSEGKAIPIVQGSYCW